MVDNLTAPERETTINDLLTLAEVSALVGDDVAYWLDNPFLGPELLAKKVCWWVTKAVRSTT